MKWLSQYVDLKHEALKMADSLMSPSHSRYITRYSHVNKTVEQQRTFRSNCDLCKTLSNPPSKKLLSLGFQRMAMALGGLATPPLTFNGSLHKKKVHLFRFRHSTVIVSKSNISPMGQPQPARRTSCIRRSGLAAIPRISQRT